MTRIESIFGGVLAVGITAVFAFVFFGEGSMSLTQPSAVTTVRTASMPGGGLLSDDDYVPPARVCDCYNYAYDFARSGKVPAGGDDYVSQLNMCYDLFAADGAAAFERGYVDYAGEERKRKSCPTEFR
ncbi:MAG: hypothetical protein AAGH41_05455 [Pseudomonadota bacterium]